MFTLLNSINIINLNTLPSLNSSSRIQLKILRKSHKRKKTIIGQKGRKCVSRDKDSTLVEVLDK